MKREKDETREEYISRRNVDKYITKIKLKGVYSKINPRRKKNGK